MKNGLMLLFCFLVTGCTAIGSSMLIGGSVVKGDYTPAKVLVTYKPLGNVPEGTQFMLIEHRGRLAMYRRDIDGAGVLYEKHWAEDDKDYYAAAFYGNGPAFIIFVPVDRSQEAGLFEYPHGSYQGTPGDRLRPMPYTPKSEPDFRLVPQ